jgi:N-acetylglucosamine-6-phosphate deacetylase
LVDLQVNGAGGIAVEGGIGAEGLAAVCDALAPLGTTACLPTLITAPPEATQAVLAAGIAAARAGTPGVLGLHLEGPHLDPRKAGAHDPALMRPMTDDDLALYLRAAADLPALMITLAPSAVTGDRIAALARAGVIVSLGHSDCTAAEAEAAFAAGARCATHLYNAMSQLGHRAPGLVGAVLSSGVAAGLIADGVHVDPLALKVALAARAEGLFLVSDCMAPAGTDAAEMLLGGRRILRRDGRLTLEDGTLAGADLTLAAALRYAIDRLGLAPDRALAMAGTVPAALVGAGHRGHLQPGARADMVLIDAGWHVERVWRGGEEMPRR